MNKFILLLVSTIIFNSAYAQTINFTKADPQPDLVDIYSGSSAAGDIDGDGDVDLIMAGISPIKKTKLYTNDGNGNFTEIVDAPFPNASESVTIFEDLDNDGDLDLFISGSSTGTLTYFTHIYLNDGFGNFTQLTNPNLPQFSVSGVAIEDVNGDGDKDLMLVVEDGNGDFVRELYSNDGSAVFEASNAPSFAPLQLASSAFIDVENDGDFDVILSGKKADGTSLVELYLNDGNGIFSLDDNSIFTQLGANEIDVADTDNDGDTDILMSGSTDDLQVKTILYTNNGEGVFTEQSTTLQNTFGGTNVLSDFDNDGDLDIVIIGSQDGGLPNIYNIVYQNEGSNIFTPVDTLGGEYIAAGVAADFNGDNLSDIVIQGFADKTNVYWNTTDVTSSTELESVDRMNMFPNPSFGQLNIHLENEVSELSIRVYSTEGKLIYDANNLVGRRHTISMDTQAGLYYVVLFTANRKIGQKLIIISGN